MRIIRLHDALVTIILLISPFVAATATAQTNETMPVAQTSFLEVLDDARRTFQVAPLQGNVELGFGAVRQGARIDPSPAAFAGTGTVSSHRGVDHPSAEGAAIVAPGPGRASRVEVSDSDTGMLLEIDHGKGLLTRYTNLGNIAVAVGEDVEAGEVIAQVGPDPDHPHLHFEVLSMRVNPGAEYFIDPETVLPPTDVR
jgi:murein DD-endopeptidase MepM/ murein hydrolase activator NlpD